MTAMWGGRFPFAVAVAGCFRGGIASVQKTSGMHCCIPERSVQTLEKRLISSSSWLSSLLPFYSPLEISKFRASNAGGARIQSPCIVIARILVKRKVSFRASLERRRSFREEGEFTVEREWCPPHQRRKSAASSAERFQRGNRPRGWHDSAARAGLRFHPSCTRDSPIASN